MTSAAIRAAARGEHEAAAARDAAASSTTRGEAGLRRTVSDRASAITDDARGRRPARRAIQTGERLMPIRNWATPSTHEQRERDEQGGGARRRPGSTKQSRATTVKLSPYTRAVRWRRRSRSLVIRSIVGVLSPDGSPQSGSHAVTGGTRKWGCHAERHIPARLRRSERAARSWRRTDQRVLDEERVVPERRARARRARRRRCCRAGGGR